MLSSLRICQRVGRGYDDSKRRDWIAELAQSISRLMKKSSFSVKTKISIKHWG